MVDLARVYGMGVRFSRKIPDFSDHLPNGAISIKIFTFSRERISCQGLLSLAY